MSVNTVETFLHRLGNDPAMIASFHSDPAALLDPYPLSGEERNWILDWNLHMMIDHGVSPMVLMFAYMAAHGGPDKARQRYIDILKSPRSVVSGQA